MYVNHYVQKHPHEEKNLICKNLNCDTIFGKSGDFSQAPTKKESIDVRRHRCFYAHS